MAADISHILDSFHGSPDEAAIFTAHLMLLDDPELLALAKSDLALGAEYAWEKAINYYAHQMSLIKDEYLKSRAADIRDVGQQVLRVLLGGQPFDARWLESPVILFAKDLTPSDTGRLDKDKILAFVTEEGSATSHTSILAKALGLPAIVGFGDALRKIPNDTLIIVDGYAGKLLVNPDENTVAQYNEKSQNEQMHHQKLLSEAHQMCFTRDGQRVEVVANVGSVEDASVSLANGAEGIGLLRTEFLYMDRSIAPNEDEQYAIYRDIFEVMGGPPDRYPHTGYRGR